jgi:hypothetical protein
MMKDKEVIAVLRDGPLKGIEFPVDGAQPTIDILKEDLGFLTYRWHRYRIVGEYFIVTYYSKGIN